MSLNRTFVVSFVLAGGMALFFGSCEWSNSNSSVDMKGALPDSLSSGLSVTQNAPSQAVAVPDLELHPELDPLKITMDNVGLVSFMASDSLDVVLDDLYSYFHLSNVGEWDAMFAHFPSHRTADTAMLTMQKEMMDKWFHQGLRNRAGGCHIRYVSPWVEEEDQKLGVKPAE